MENGPQNKQPLSESSDTPIFDELRREFQDFDNFETILQHQPHENDNVATELQRESGVAAADDLHERTIDNLDEALARGSLMQSESLNSDINEKATARIRALNTKDRVQRQAMLLTARQLRYEGRVARLEKKYNSARPGSRRAMKLEEAMAIAHYRLGKINTSQHKIFSRMHERSFGFKNEQDKIEKIEQRRNRLILKRKIALEIKRRNKVKKQYEHELKKKRDPQLIQKLHNEIKGWKNDSKLTTYYRAIQQEINDDYHKRLNESRKI